MNKNVVITGVSTGIGRMCVLYLTRQGYRVFGTVRNSADAEPLTAECGDRFVPLIMDVENTDSIQLAAKQVADQLGKDENLLGLVNNAGVAFGGPLLLSSMDEFKKQFDINVFGLLQVTRSFFPLLQSTETAGAGRIINIGSVSGKRALPFTGPYVASKHALEGLTDVMRMEFLLYDVDVILIEPGPVQSAIWVKTPDPEDNP